MSQKKHRYSFQQNVKGKICRFLAIFLISYIGWIIMDKFGAAFTVAVQACLNPRMKTLPNLVEYGIEDFLSIHVMLRAGVTTLFYLLAGEKLLHSSYISCALLRLLIFMTVLEVIKLTTYMPEFLLSAAVRLSSREIPNLLHYGVNDLKDVPGLIGQAFLLTNLWFVYYKRADLLTIEPTEEERMCVQKYYEERNRRHKAGGQVPVEAIPAPRTVITRPYTHSRQEGTRVRRPEAKKANEGDNNGINFFSAKVEGKS